MVEEEDGGALGPEGGAHALDRALAELVQGGGAGERGRELGEGSRLYAGIRGGRLTHLHALFSRATAKASDSLEAARL
jgi:hypothetical protein